MKKVLLKELIPLALMFITILIPGYLLDNMYQYSEDMAILSICKYVLMSVAWMVLIYYIVSRIIYYLDQK